MKNDYGSLVSKFTDRSFLMSVGAVFAIYGMAAQHQIPYPLAAVLIAVKVGIFIVAEKYKDSVYLSGLRSLDTALSAELPPPAKVSIARAMGVAQPDSRGERFISAGFGSPAGFAPAPPQAATPTESHI